MTIFLDFDGVIVTYFNRCKTGDPNCISVLNSILNYFRFTYEVEIVVCSTWRYNYSSEELESLLGSWGCPCHVVGVTDSERCGKSREEVISDYIEKHGVINYLVIDDEDYNHPSINPEWPDGLQQHHYDEVVRRFPLLKGGI